MADITRSYWVEAIQEENVKFVEKIFAALNKETGCEFAPNYTQSYIGAGLNGKNSHMINVKQGKNGLRISIQVKQTAAIDSTLKSCNYSGHNTIKIYQAAIVANEVLPQHILLFAQVADLQ